MEHSVAHRSTLHCVPPVSSSSSSSSSSTRPRVQHQIPMAIGDVGLDWMNLLPGCVCGANPREGGTQGGLKQGLCAR